MKTFDKKKRALYISAFIPSAQARHAGGYAAFTNINSLKENGYEVTALICTTEKEVTDIATCESVQIFRQTKLSFVAGVMRALASAKSYDWFFSGIFDTRANLSFEKALHQEIKKNFFDLVFVDFTQAILPFLRSGGKCMTAKKICCIHDVYIQKYIRRSDVTSLMWLGWIAYIERRLLKTFDEIRVLSDKDKELLTHFYDIKNVKVMNWIPPLWVKNVKRCKSLIRKGLMLFFGNFGRIENREAALWFYENAWPKIRENCTCASLVFAGAQSDKLFDGTKVGCQVELLGYVDNPASLFQQCDIFIAPLKFGAGVKFKVLEALACGVRVVGTAVAFEGIPKTSLMIEADRECFAGVIIQMLSEGEAPQVFKH